MSNVLIFFINSINKANNVDYKNSSAKSFKLGLIE